jgi:nucleoside-diphosphate-sugar epimerase
MKLFIFGIGYTAEQLIRDHAGRFTAISGTVRSAEKALRIRRHGIAAHAYAGGDGGPDMVADLAGADALLITAAPDASGDPMLRYLRPALGATRQLGRIIYLSTVGVYGDHQGQWIDETAPTRPTSPRGVYRLEAEQAWAAVGMAIGAAVQAHRLPGIYGPGRNAIVDLRAGHARRIIKPGQVFNRCHVADIAGCIASSLSAPPVSGAFNVTDDLPCPPQDVVAHAADLIGMPPPPEVPFEQAELSEMGRSFYGESKRCRNDRAKSALEWRLRYPTYREGLAALLAAGA